MTIVPRFSALLLAPHCAMKADRSGLPIAELLLLNASAVTETGAALLNRRLPAPGSAIAMDVSNAYWLPETTVAEAAAAAAEFAALVADVAAFAADVFE